VFYVLEAEGEALAVFEPLLGWLIASDEEVPGRFRHTLEILLCIDIDTIILPTIAIYLLELDIH
jgi:hypothetical protein